MFCDDPSVLLSGFSVGGFEVGLDPDCSFIQPTMFSSFSALHYLADDIYK